MEDARKKEKLPLNEVKDEVEPKYIPPRITTYTSEQILQQIGPAQAGSKACMSG